MPWTWKQRSPRSRSAGVIFLCAHSLAGLLRARFGRNGERVFAQEAEAEASAEPKRKRILSVRSLAVHGPGVLRARFGRNGEKVGALEEAEAEAAEPKRKKPRVNCKVEG